jgi:lipooligosaccharide transport system permease protein
MWRKLAGASLAANFGEPILVILALGYGLGGLVGTVGGMPYFVFLASGIVCSSTMMTASFEGTYSAYTRMAVQKTWDAITTTPIDVSDVVVGEVAWAATKATVSATCILVVAALLGVVESWSALLALPVILLTGFCFGALAMVVTALSRSYDFFLYYTTLFVTPMFLLSGVFFPLEQMPDAVQRLSLALPLAHAVAVVRPLVVGTSVAGATLHLLVVAAYAGAALGLAVWLIRRRMRA